MKDQDPIEREVRLVKETEMHQIEKREKVPMRGERVPLYALSVLSEIEVTILDVASHLHPTHVLGIEHGFSNELIEQRPHSHW